MKLSFEAIMNSSYSTIVKNSFFLTILEVIELCIPFVAMPYIIKTVGSDNFGKIAFAQAIVSYFAIFVNFGINIVAAKEIAVNQNNKKEINKIFGSVLAIKTGLCLISLIAFCCLVFFWDKSKNDWILFFSAYGVCFADIFFTRWLFQGLEKMFMITLIRASSLIIYIFFLFIFVNKTNDYYKVPLFQTSCLIFTSIIAIIYTIKSEKIYPVYPGYTYIFHMLKDCSPFFFSRASITINTSIATTVIGITLSDHFVACYDLSIKIARTAIIPIDMIGQAIYPYNSRKRNSRFAFHVLLGVILLSIVMLIALFFCIPFLVEYLGKGKLIEAALLSRILLLYSFLGAMSIFLGTPLLVAWGYNRPFNNSIYVATILLICIYGSYYLFDVKNVYMYCIALICAEAGLALYRLFHCIKNKIL